MQRWYPRSFNQVRDWDEISEGEDLLEINRESTVIVSRLHYHDDRMLISAELKKEVYEPALLNLIKLTKLY